MYVVFLFFFKKSTKDTKNIQHLKSPISFLVKINSFQNKIDFFSKFLNYDLNKIFRFLCKIISRCKFKNQLLIFSINIV